MPSLKMQKENEKNVIDEHTINDVNYQKLKELFPHVISKGGE
jgi:hypothetical protein